MAFIDMDRLKPINDTFGHQAGDAAIADNTAAIRERLHRELHARNTQPNRRYSLRVSIGMVTRLAALALRRRELAQADALMYEEKQRGRLR